MKEFGRLFTAMVTPFNESGEVDYAQAQKLALALLDSGSDGVLVVGTTGESPTLLKEEELKLFAAVKEAVGDRAPVMAGTGSNSTAEAIEATRKAEEIGIDCCLLVAPYYNKPNQEGLYQHFKAVAESTKLPIVLYNVPGRTVSNISAETVSRLSKIENIIGIKEASGNLAQIANIIRLTDDSFKVWSGNDGDTLPLLAVGGYGIISVVSHLVGKQLKKMMELFLAGNTVESAAIHRNLLPLVDAMFIVSNPVPVKYALNQIGFQTGKPRLPLVEPDDKSAAVIRETLKQYTIDLPV